MSLVVPAEPNLAISFVTGSFYESEEFTTADEQLRVIGPELHAPGGSLHCHGKAADAAPDSRSPLDQTVRQFDHFYTLNDGWNSYKAKAPSVNAVEWGKQFVTRAFAFDMEPFSFGPSVVGGIGVTFRSAERMGFVEFYNDGSAYLVLSDDASEPNIRPVSPEGFDAVLDEIRGYLNA